MNIDIQNNMNFEDDSAELFSIIQVPWKKTSEEVWTLLSEQMQIKPIFQMKSKIAYWQIAAAAMLIISLSIGIFMRSYTLSYNALLAQTFSAELPDGSNIVLNAGSQINYKPYWWWANRHVDLQGEAFFEVKKGKTFTVESAIGTTEVLGTSFNIFSRGERYEVTCITGKVKVMSKSTQHSVIIHPAQKANLQKTGQLEIEEKVNTENVKAWMSDRLVFTSLPITEVFKEIERQYEIEIIVPEGLSQHYTGSFEKSESVEKVLNFICRPFEFKVEKKGNKQFLILK